MPGNNVVRLRWLLVVSIGAVLLLPCAVQAQVSRKVQAARPPKAESSAVYSEAMVRTEEGKNITVALDALSAEDQQFLKSAKPQN